MLPHAFRRVVALGAATALTCTLAVAVAPAATAAVTADPVTVSAPSAALELTPIGSYETGVFDESAAEIVQAHGDRLFVVNAKAGVVDVLDTSDPAAPAKLFSIAARGVANSVAIREDGLGAIALEADDKTAAGRLVFFDADAGSADAAVLGAVSVGSLPDMVTITDDGRYAVVANEGEPADDFSVDPEGSISVITLPSGRAAPGDGDVRTAGFGAFEAPGALEDDVRIFGPTPHGDDAPVSRNLEPEYITVVGGTAYATLQEANAIAVVDLARATVTDIHALGFKDLGLAGNALDASDRDGGYRLRSYDGLNGIYMPDAIDSYTVDGTTYLVTANEGDAREWGDYVEPARVKDLGKKGLAPVCADSPLAGLTGDADLGRLTVTTADGLDEAGTCYEELYAFGGRSISIWTTTGDLVWDSGSSLEKVTADAAPDFFNSNHSESGAEGRSDDKGPEPEAVTIGTLSGRTYAFVGLERVGGIAAYDITDPASASFVTYVNNRDFAESVEDGGDLSRAGDLGPESVAFIPAAESPTGVPLLAVGNEVSGTTTLFRIEDALAPIEIDVLTINDFHGRLEQNLANGEAGAAVIAGAVDAFEAANPNTLFVSGGDNIGASTFTSFIQQDEPTIDALTAAGLDLGAVGNHEFDGGFADLTDRVLPRFGGDRFGLGANVYRKGTTTPALREYAIQEVDGVRVGFIGTVTEQTAAMVSPDGIAGLDFGDQREAVDRVAAQIADETDVIVLLTHEGSAVDSCEAIATEATEFGRLVREASDEVDAIVSGHTHQEYACEVAGRPVVQAHQYGTTLGKLDISVDRASGSLVSIAGSVVPLVEDGAAAFDADPQVAALVAEAVAVAAEAGAVPVGEISADILRGGTAGSDRGVESSLGNLVADMYLWAASNEDYAGTPAQIGIMNPGGLRADLLFGDDGTQSYRDVANVQPFANTLVTVTLTGAQLKAVLEEQWQPAGSSRPKLHLGVSEGFAYEYDPDAARGERIGVMTLDGAALTADDPVTVVTNSFLAGGGDNFASFAEGTDRTDTGQVDLAASVAYFAARDVVDPAPLGRAVVAEPGEPGTPGEPGEPGTPGEPGEPGTPGEPEPTDPPQTGGDDAGDSWATVELSADSVRQGGALRVTLSDLVPGQRVGATLHSEPIVVAGIPAADAAGRIVFTVSIPRDLEPGEHTLVLETPGEDDIRVAVTVTPDGELASSGGDAGPLGALLAGAGLLVALGAILMRRRRQAA
ncbi:choice-of-anchor I family protein [Microbacterium sp. 179-B 1A2 NHS]|uniref:choice-of-anchor I family protein n=1 Tax=Microbacterium sp. 179-B 1A2 NHS TaxID=3142383 RepID=UPI0039A09857